jgi:chemotaxis protein CheD
MLMSSRKLIVNVSDAKASSEPGDSIITYSLGSCIGVSLYDAAAKVGGMLHFQLPESVMDPAKAAGNPFMFADSGMNAVFNMMLSLGAIKKRIRVKLAGGAAMAIGPKGFDIGKRNHLAIRKILWQNGIFIEGEDVGGDVPRNLYLNVADGMVIVKANGSERTL